MAVAAIKHLLPLAGALLTSELAAAEPAPLSIPVNTLLFAPTVNGEITEWDSGEWITVPIHPAVENDKKNRTKAHEITLQLGVHTGILYVAARWADARPDSNYREWRWDGKRYRRGRNYDDMFALRLDMAGDYHSCMLSGTDYQVDLWLWSAGRSNQVGYAEDLWQNISTAMLDGAAEHEGPDQQTIYVKEFRDKGKRIFSPVPPPKHFSGEERISSIKLSDSPDGSAADVKAKGLWVDGYWQLELSRALQTHYSDDVQLAPGIKKLAGIAVFNAASDEHKSVSYSLELDFSGL